MEKNIYELLEQGNCVQADPNLFFPEGKEWAILTRQAKELCSGCPVVKECLDYAIESKQEWGIWGGTTAKERIHIRKHPTIKSQYLEVLIESKGKRDCLPLKDENSVNLD